MSTRYSHEHANNDSYVSGFLNFNFYQSLKQNHLIKSPPLTGKKKKKKKKD